MIDSRVNVEAAFLGAHDAEHKIERSEAEMLRVASFAATLRRAPDGSLSPEDAARLRAVRGTPPATAGEYGALVEGRVT